MVTIDAGSPVPPYEQLRARLVDQIGAGTRTPGEQLPTVRALAAELGLAPNTVAKAYRELEQEGYVVTAGRRGTVVADQHAPADAEARREAERFVARVRALGLGPGETSRLVRQVLGG